MTYWIILPAVLGALVGVFDTLGVVSGGFAKELGWAPLGTLLSINVMALAIFGGLLGSLLFVVAASLKRLGVQWSDDALAVRGKPLIGRERLPAALLGGYLFIHVLSYGVVGGSLLGPGPIRPRSMTFGLICVAAGLAAFALYKLLAWTRSRLVILLGALLLGGLHLAFLSRLLYMFSRQGALGVVHGASLAALLVFAAIFTQAWGVPRRAGLGARSSIASIVALLASGAFFNCVPASSSHQMRVLVHERTTLAFRALQTLPACRFAADPLAQLEDLCAETPAASQGAAGASPSRTSAKHEPVRGAVIVMIDSLRADRLETRREERWLTPNLRRFAEQATVFEDAYVTVPATTHALPSFVTGRYPHAINASLLQEQSLASFAARSGLETSAVAAHRNLEASLGRFDVYDDRFIVENMPDQKNAHTSPSITRAAVEHLSRIAPEERFISFIHYYDPHAHYVRNELFDFGWTEEDRYDAEVAYTDHWLGELFEHLKDTGLWEEAAIVVISDHGEEFWDHNYKRHQVRIYDESSRMAFMVRLPGQQEARRVEQPVSGLDLLPTLLDVLGIDHPAILDGRSLRPALDGERVAARRVFLHSSNFDKLGVVAGDHKLIVNRDIRAVELYDLRADPAELDNLAERDPKTTQQLFCEVNQWAEREQIWRK